MGISVIIPWQVGKSRDANRRFAENVVLPAGKVIPADAGADRKDKGIPS